MKSKKEYNRLYYLKTKEKQKQKLIDNGITVKEIMKKRRDNLEPAYLNYVIKKKGLNPSLMTKEEKEVIKLSIIINREIDKQYSHISKEERRSLYSQLYYIKNQERIKKRNNAYCLMNPEKTRIRQRKWYLANKDKAKEAKKRWRSIPENRAKELAYKKEYRKRIKMLKQ